MINKGKQNIKIKPDKIIFCFIIVVIIFFSAQHTLAVNEPIILFSDMTDAPVTGWDGSSTKGAAVTIWCRNIGTSRGSSYVTVTNGSTIINLMSDSDYGEWGAITNPTVPLGMQRITFYLNSSMATSGTYPNSTIKVTVGGVSSGTLKFHCRALGSNRIYFFDNTYGIDSATGTITSPKKTTDWFRANAVAGDIAYFRAGQWGTGYGNKSAVWALDSAHNNGAEGKSIITSAYPNEVVTFGDAIGHGSSGTPIVISAYETATPIHYWTFSKFNMEASDYAVVTGRSSSNITFGSSYFRIIGNDITTNHNTDNNVGCGLDMAGAPGGIGMNHFFLLGNYIHDLATDSRYEEITSTGRKYGIYIEGYGQWENIYIGYNEWGYFGLTGGSGGRAIDVFGHQATDTINNLHIFNNFAYESGRNLIEIGGGDGDTHYSFVSGTAYVYNNIFDASQDNNNARLSDDPVIQFNGAGDTAGSRGGTFYFYNNTVVNKLTGAGDTEGIIVSYQANSYIRNNIVETHNSDNVYIRQKYGSWAGICGPNLYYGHVSAGKPVFDTTSTLDPADPEYTVAPSTPFAYTNYFPKSTSPAIGAGANLGFDIPSIQLTGLNLPGVAVDFLGKTRGNTYDIGAFEYDGEYIPPVNNTAPAAPGGLSVK